MDMFFLEVAMCEKCRSSHFQLEGGVKSWGGLKNLGTGGITNLGGVLLSLGGGQYPITCHDKKNHLKFSWVLVFDLQISKGCHTISEILKGTVTT